MADRLTNQIALIMNLETNIFPRRFTGGTPGNFCCLRAKHRWKPQGNTRKFVSESFVVKRSEIWDMFEKKISTDDLSDFDLTRTRSQSNRIISWFVCKVAARSVASSRRKFQPAVHFPDLPEAKPIDRADNPWHRWPQGDRQVLVSLSYREFPRFWLFLLLALLQPRIWRQFSVCENWSYSTVALENASLSNLHLWHRKSGNRLVIKWA